MSETVFGWFRRNRNSPSPAKARIEKPRNRRSAISIMALEPRIMYDAAAAATVGAAQAHNDPATDHNAITAAEQQTVPVTPSNSGAADAHATPAPNVPAAAAPEDIKTVSARDASATEALAAVAPHDIVFIDSRVPNVSALLGGLKPGTEAFVLDPDKDGLTQITDIIESNNLHDLSAVQIVSHGLEGEVRLGSATLTDGNLAQYSEALGKLGAALAPGGDIMLYGCDVGHGDAGQQFMRDLSTYTGGADIAASTDPVGTTSTGVNWSLDVSTGPIKATNPFTPEALASYDGTLVNPLTGQLWYLTQGTATDPRIAHVNADGSSDTVEIGSTGLPTNPVNDIQVDTAAGLYYVISSDFNAANGKLLMGHIGSNAAPTVLVTFPTSSSINTLQIDPITHHLYVGEQDQVGTGNKEGIHDYTYDPVTGAVTAVSTNNGWLVRADQQSTILPTTVGSLTNVTLFDPTDFAFDKTTDTLFWANLEQGTAKTNQIYKISLSNPTIVTPLLQQSQFPTATTGNFPNGYINSVEVDPSTGLVYFTTRSNAPGSATFDATLNKIYYISETASGSTAATEVTMTGLPAGTIFYSRSTAFDLNSRQLYVTSEGSGDTAGADAHSADDVILVFQLDASGHSASYVQTIAPTPAFTQDFSNFSGSTFNALPVLTLGATATHAGEQGGFVDLTASNGSIDADGGYYSGAIVQITGGTFATGETSASDDHLTVLDNGTNRSSGLVTGTNITVSYDSATEKLTLSGYDTIANYNAVLGHVQYNTTGDNPTNFGANTTRTVSWSVSDGTQSIPFGAGNSGQTTLNIDAVNDAPVVAGPSAHYAATEAANLSLRNTGFSVSDVDAGTGVLTATLSVGEGVLTIAAGNSGITGLTGNGSGSVSFSGTVAQINALLNTSTGTITFKDSVHRPVASTQLTLSVNDGGNTGSGAQITAKTATIDITALNSVPVLSASTNPASVDEADDASAQNIPAITGTLTVSDADVGDTLTASVAGNGIVKLNGSAASLPGGVNLAALAASSAISFSPLISNGAAQTIIWIYDPAAANLDFLKSGDQLTIDYVARVNDGVDNSTTRTLTVTITGTDDAPVITSNGGASSAVVLVPENGTALTTVRATDADAGASLTYSISGGPDSLLFAIDQSSGVLRFIAAPNFEAPADADRDNVYDVEVTVSDGAATDTQAIAVTVTNVNEAPVISSNGGGASAALNVVENTTAVTTVLAADPDQGAVLTYTLSGTDAGKFTIDQTTGALSFVTAPDREAPADANADNVYNVSVQVSDGTLSDTQALTVTVTDLNDTTPVFTSSATPSVAENTTDVVVLTTTDADTTGGNPAHFIIVGGADAALFQLAADGKTLQFITAPNYEADPHSYEVIVRATDGLNMTDQTLTVSLTDTNDNAPVFTSTASPSVAENTTSVVSLATTDADTAGSNPPAFSVVGGTDQAKFRIGADGHTLEFIAAKNYETDQHSYQVVVRANDGVNTTDQTLTVTLTDVNDTAPVITTAASQSVAENTTLVAALTATDADTVGGPVTFSLTGGTDQSLFAVSGGNLVFNAPRDYETQAHSYQVQVSAFDGVNTTNKMITVTLTDVNEAPVAMADTGTAGENETKSFNALANDTDPDAGDSKTLTALGAVSVTSGNTVINGIDASALFTIAAGQIKFTPGTQFDALQAGQTATIVVAYTMRDTAGLTSSSELTLTVNGSNDAPVASIAPLSFAATEQTVLNLKTSGLSVSDIDGGSDVETVTLSVGEGALTVTAGTSGATVSGSGTGSVTITGTLAQINALLTSDGSSTVTYRSASDAPTAQTLTLAVNDGHDTHSDTAAISIAPVNDAPSIAITQPGYSATEGLSLSLKNTGLTVTDVDGGSGIETVTLSVGEGVLTATAGATGVTVSGSGTSTITLSGRTDQINALLGAGTGTLSYIDNNDRPSASTLLTVSVNDGGNTGGSALAATAAVLITIAPANDAPVGVADAFSVTANPVGGTSSLIVPAAFGLLSNDTDADGNALTIGTVNGSAANVGATITLTRGTLTVTANGGFTYTPTAGAAAGTDTFTYTATDGTAQSGSVTVTLTVAANSSGTAPADTVWVATQGITAAENGLLRVNTDGTLSPIFRDTDVNGTPTPLVGLKNLVVDVASNLYFVLATPVNSTTLNPGKLYMGHLDSAAAPTLVYVNPDNDLSGYPAFIDLAIDASTHTLYLSQNASYESGATANNGIFAFTYDTTSGALSNKTAVVTVDPRYSDTKIGSQIFYMADTPINGVMFYSEVDYHTWDGTFQVWSYNLNTHVTTAVTAKTWLPVFDYHNNIGTYILEMDYNTANNKLYVWTQNEAGYNPQTGYVTTFKLWMADPTGGTPPAEVTINFNPADTAAARAKYFPLTFDSGTGQFIFAESNTNNVEFFNVSADGKTLNYSSAISLGARPVSVFYTPGDRAPTNAMTSAYTTSEQTTLVLKNTGLSVADADAGNTVETVRLIVAEGTLNVSAGGSGATVSGSGTGSVTITGTVAQLNALLNTDASSTVGYINSSDTPSAHTTLTFSVTDSFNLTATDVATIFITAVNDAPVAAIGPASYSATEQTALNLKNNGLAISDIDAGTSSIVSVTLSVGDGVLNVTAGGSGVTVNGGGTNTVTLSGTVNQIKSLLTTDATSTVSYINNSDTPVASTTLTLTVNDNGNAGSGGAKTGSDTAVINITAVNDAPVARDDVYSGIQNTVINGSSVLANDSDVDTAAAGLQAVLVSGPGHASTFTLNANGTFTYTPANGFSGADYFTYKVNDGASASNIVSVTLNIASSPLVASADSYTGANGATEDTTLVVSAPNGVLANDADEPGRTVTAALVAGPAHGTLTLATDGSFTYRADENYYGTDSFTYQAVDGVNAPSVGTVTISIAAVNDAPVLAQPSPTAATYIENAAPTALFAGEAVFDVDNPANFAGGRLNVAITSGAAAGDQVALLGASGFSVTGGVLFDGATAIGAASTTATSFSVDLYAAAAASVVNRLATAFGYANTTDSPGNGDRVVTLTFNDGGNVGTGTTVDVSATQTIHVTPVADAPVVSAGNSVGYTEQSASVTIGGGVTISDTDSATLSRAVVTITDYVAGDTLVAPPGAVVVSNANGVLVLTLTGGTTPADYQAALRQVAFVSGSDDPTTGGTHTTRTITWSVTDETSADSNSATTTLTITAVNDAPTIVAPAGLRALPGAAVPMTGVSFADPDGGSLVEQVTFSATSGSFGGSSGAGVTITGAGTSRVLSGSIADINAYLAAGSLTFTPMSGAVSTDVSVTISDLGHTGLGAQTASATVTITGNSPPAAPIDADSVDNSVQEGAAAGTVINLTARATDADPGDTIAYSIVGRAGNAFQIDASTGVVTVRDGSLIDYESNAGHTITLTIQADDGHGGTSTADFAIAVTDKAPTVPADATGTEGGTISEGAVNGATVGITATASDINGGTVTYSLTDDAGQRFQIDSSTGVVTVRNAALLNYESAETHSITVQASDGTLTSSKSFTIDVTDVAPTTPADADAAGNSVSEGAVNGASVGVTASSSDVHGGTVTYSLSSDAGGRFAIDAATGVVSVANASLLNFESNTTHDIVVRSADPSGAYTDQTFTIAVTDVAPTAPFDSDGTTGGSIREDAVNGDRVGITAASTDIHGGDVIYSLSNSAGGRFAIDAATGVVSVANASMLDFERNASHTIVVRSADLNGLFNETTFTIEVTDFAPYTPADANAAANTVVEGAANGTIVGVTAATTDVHGGTVTYALSGDASGGGFAINSATGVVTVADGTKIDFESSGGSYEITVKASDPTGAFTEQSFIIAVTDVAPVATGETLVTDEDTAIEKNATQGLLANDTDINGAPLSAVLDSGPAHGTLTLNADGSFRYLSFQDYNGTDSFTYHVSDGTLSSATVTVSLTVNAVNDAPVLTSGATLAFDANTGKASVIDPSIALHDVDNATLSGAKVAISSGYEAADDKLGFVNQHGITGAFDSATGVLTLTGTASVADYQAALASITFISTTQSNGVRTVQWTVDDGSALYSQSVPTQTTLNVSGLIPAPSTFTSPPAEPAPPANPPAPLGFDTKPADFGAPQADRNDVSSINSRSYQVVIASPVMSMSSDNVVHISVALGDMNTALGGDMVSVTARLANGDALPSWLKFDPATGEFTGTPPDGMVASLDKGPVSDDELVTGSLPPKPGPAPVPPAGTTITVQMTAVDSSGNVVVKLFTVKLMPRPKQGWIDMPSLGLERHASLSPELAAIEAAIRGDTGVSEPFALRGLPLHDRGAILIGERLGQPAGRTGLTAQMASIGWRSMEAQRNALLASLRNG